MVYESKHTMELIRRYEYLPVGECLACERSVDDCDDYELLGNGKFLCSDCNTKVEAEIKEIVPYWFDHPLVDGEPAQEPVLEWSVPKLEPVPEHQDSTTYQCGECQGEHPQHTMCPKLPTVKAVVVSRVPLFEALTEAEQMKWIMIGQSGRGENYDTQMLAQYSKWERGKAA